MGDVLLAAVGALIVLGAVTAATTGRAWLSRRRRERRAREHAERVEAFEARLRALAEDIARAQGIPLDEASAYVRAGVVDLMRRGRR